MKRPPRHLCLWIAGLALVAACQPAGQPQPGQPMGDAVRPASFAVRAARRAFDGAPPVIPHGPLGASCVACHTATGQASPPIGFAPANPHLNSPQASATANCRQCHVFRRDTGEFQPSGFMALPIVFHASDRLFRGAPPVIPHSLQLRENCQACHATPAGRPEIRCSHPERTNCVQCHLVQRSDEPPLSAGEPIDAAAMPSVP